MESYGFYRTAQFSVTIVIQYSVKHAFNELKLLGHRNSLSVHINDGDTIGIINKEIVVSEPERIEAAHALIDKLLSGGDRFLLTVFVGVDATAEEAAALEQYVMQTYPGTEAYFIDGGQEIYPYLFVAE